MTKGSSSSKQSGKKSVWKSVSVKKSRNRSASITSHDSHATSATTLSTNPSLTSSETKRVSHSSVSFITEDSSSATLEEADTHKEHWHAEDKNIAMILPALTDAGHESEYITTPRIDIDDPIDFHASQEPTMAIESSVDADMGLSEIDTKGMEPTKDSCNRNDPSDTENLNEDVLMDLDVGSASPWQDLDDSTRVSTKGDDGHLNTELQPSTQLESHDSFSFHPNDKTPDANTDKNLQGTNEDNHHTQDECTNLKTSSVSEFPVMMVLPNLPMTRGLSSSESVTMDTESRTSVGTDPDVDMSSDSSAHLDLSAQIDKTDSGIFISKSGNDVGGVRKVALRHVNNEKEEENRLGSLLPAMEKAARQMMESIRVDDGDDEDEDDGVTPEDLERADHSREFEHSIEDPIDLDMFRDNVISIETIDAKSVPANKLGPREQEEADEPVRQGMQFLFDNKFMKAKSTFQSKASIDPLYALGLGAMAFIKAIMTYHSQDMDMAMNALTTACSIAQSQIDNTTFKRSVKGSLSNYFSSLIHSDNPAGLPSHTPTSRSQPPQSSPEFIPNALLRAHVIKAECCLLMCILQMTHESVMGYVKCGLNLRTAYKSYSLVWREYKRMGQDYIRYIDRDTVSAIQFGIGAVHLILSSLPPKILKIFSTLGWESDKQLGFALLKICLESDGIRSPLASLTLLSYYSVLTSFAPQLYVKDMLTPALECLLHAQKKHPNSCFFLFFAARISRIAQNIPLSSQSFSYAAKSSRGEWAETAMKQMTDYETGFNHMLQLDWEGAALYFEQLSREKYWSPAYSKYVVGACYDILGRRTESILAFAEVPQLAKEQRGRNTYMDSFVQKKVEFFQTAGYQDMDFCLPALELMLVLNAYRYMETSTLEQCLDLVQRTLEMVYQREKMEYTIRLKELVPRTSPPDYFDHRAVLLLIKSAILNCLGRHQETIAHLNWIIDHQSSIKVETWVVPFTYWESGMTSWELGNRKKSRKLWELALNCTKYDFEYRMAVRLSLALSKCDDQGIHHVEHKATIGPTTHGRKRMPLAGIRA